MAHTIEIGTQVPLGGATGINLWGTVTKLDGFDEMASAKVECCVFTRWYPVSQLRSLLASQ